MERGRAGGPHARRGGGGNRGRGSKGSSGRGRGFARGGGGGRYSSQKRDLGRSQYNKQKGNDRLDKREANAEQQAAKRQKVEDGADEKALPIYATKFTEEELKDEERRPKKKVAVLIGYSGTGYRGMQLAPDQKTIEGDLFKAFVAAGAISKANADDPKKSSFVRCARTDKGVHAAGNVISLKLIVEDEDIVQRINDNLAPQIRVWGIERTSNSFSAYQMVDSRIYEYLIPTHAFLPPHPRSWLGKKSEEWAKKKSEFESWEARQREVEGYWEKVDEEVIMPILSQYEGEIRIVLEKALWLMSEEEAAAGLDDDDDGGGSPDANSRKEANGGEESSTTEAAKAVQETAAETKDVNVSNGEVLRVTDPEVKASESKDADDSNDNAPTIVDPASERTTEEKKARTALINEGTKKLRQAYIAAKRSYRIDEARLQRVRDVLQLYVGTRNYHNYTIAKTARDPSAKRVIRSFVIHGNPLIINGTEWLSLKVHGQSFMMHQIRKMVGMAALVVRCGCDPNRVIETYGQDKISIPKAPSLGLLLERPVFDSYNKKAQNELSRGAIDFKKYEQTMDEFKQREIYDRMHADEEKDNIFGNFFNHVDNFPSEAFLFVTAGGIEATKTPDKDAADPASKRKLELTDAGIGEDGEEVDSDAEPDVKDGAGNEG